MAKLYFRYGAMNCGKSSQLLQVAYNYEEKGMNVLLLKPGIDTKGEDAITSRLGISRKVDFIVSEDESIIDIVAKQDVEIGAILVDEAQFLTKSQVDELYFLTKRDESEGNRIPVISYGLRTDFLSELFEGSARLLSLADAIEELKTICECGKKATLNMRFKENVPIFSGQQVQIDSDNSQYSYSSACGECYLAIKKLHT